MRRGYLGHRRRAAAAAAAADRASAGARRRRRGRSRSCPAARPTAAACAPGDLLVELDGRRLTGVQDVQRLMEDEVIGTRVVVSALRDGRERRMTVVPRELGS